MPRSARYRRAAAAATAQAARFDAAMRVCGESRGKSFQFGACPVRQGRYLFIIKAILKDSKVVVCWIVKAFARTSASSS
ncbi:hypothetical protein CY652_14670 [Burkholderia sp. WAC0059]|nr:hypothetical protein CY652_14670 [Burkholderia sp. WAC0059]